ncbi:hypothetical protein [Burkholderia cenocepacia]|uniref:hypothetical protein n=1 Tax=Burkholderia cenocepacia TaxID=95486 RepID=UPI002AB32720|nr:hypothetical protein [Burkholderia cenocepacia]
MALPTQWFANRGQIVQTMAAAAGLLGSIGSAYTKAPLWLTAGLIGIAIGFVAALLTQLGVRSTSAVPVDQAQPTPQSALVLVSHEFVADDREQIHYKRKLYLEFQNSREKALVIGPGTTWKHADLHVNTTLEHVWQVEGSKGFRNNDWSNEATAVIVPPGMRVRTWVGLPNGARKHDVDAYLSQHRAGALVTHVAWQNKSDLAI